MIAANQEFCFDYTERPDRHFDLRGRYDILFAEAALEAEYRFTFSCASTRRVRDRSVRIKKIRKLKTRVNAFPVCTRSIARSLKPL